LPWANHCGGSLANGRFALSAELLTPCEVGDRRRSRQRTSMYPLKSPFLGQFAQVTPDRVFGNAQFLAQRLRDQLTVLSKPLQEKLLSLNDEHRRRQYVVLRQSARKYMKMHEIAV
jgi:hypothetical protein